MVAKKRGVYTVDNKIFYSTKPLRFLKRVKHGTLAGSTERRNLYYDVENPDNIELVAGKRYWFELVDGKAKIVS